LYDWPTVHIVYCNDIVYCAVQSGIKQSHGVELTSLSYIPGARIDHYPGHLNFFIIRETTSVREVCSSYPQYVIVLFCDQIRSIIV